MQRRQTGDERERRVVRRVGWRFENRPKPLQALAMLPVAGAVRGAFCRAGRARPQRAAAYGQTKRRCALAHRHRRRPTPTPVPSSRLPPSCSICSALVCSVLPGPARCSTRRWPSRPPRRMSSQLCVLACMCTAPYRGFRGCLPAAHSLHNTRRWIPSPLTGRTTQASCFTRRHAPPAPSATTLPMRRDARPWAWRPPAAAQSGRSIRP
jgi:hypothetical protein